MPSSLRPARNASSPFSTRSATSRTSEPLLLPKVASFATFWRASRKAASSFSASGMREVAANATPRA